MVRGDFRGLRSSRASQGRPLNSEQSMPSIRFGTATTADALSNLQFSTVPIGGAILNVWVSSVTNGDNWGLSIGNSQIVVNGTECNIEVSADVIQVSDDQMVFDEVIGGGQLFFPATVTTELQALLALRYL